MPDGRESGTPLPAVKIDEPVDLLATRATCHLIEAAIMAEVAAEGKGEYGAVCLTSNLFLQQFHHPRFMTFTTLVVRRG